jgi:hypothetical protein
MLRDRVKGIRATVCGLFLLVFLTCLPARVMAQQRPQEYAVKAAYLYNFGKFAKWPSETPSFNICLLGKDPFGSSLDRTVAGESIDGKPIAVRRLNDLGAVRDCEILFVSSSERGRMAWVLAQVQNLPILTVSDAPEFLDRGGMIQFELQNDRVRFSINLRAARDAKLNISSELLNVATRVEGR